jgi:hypothetical protein
MAANPDPLSTTVVKTVTSQAVTAGTAITVWTPASGKRFRLLGWSLSSSAAASLLFRYGATPTTFLVTEKVAAAGISQNPPGFANGLRPGAVDEVLKIDVSGNATVEGYVFGREE